MINLMRMPQKGLSEESALLAGWYIKKGDTVKEGDYLFAIETNKATFDIESEVSGIVLETFGEVGEDIPIKTVMCAIGNKDDIYVPENGVAPEKTVNELVSTSLMEVGDGAPTPNGANNPEPARDERLKISPRARKLSEQMHVDPSRVVATGPKGRIVEKDICESDQKGAFAIPSEQTVNTLQDYSKEQLATDVFEYEVVRNTIMRKTIAKNMHHSLAEMAQFTMTAAFDATAILDYRKVVKEVASSLEVSNITLNDMIVFTVSRVILDYPYLNAHYSDTEMKLYKNANIGVAVDTQRGLMVPTIMSANTRSLSNISDEIRLLVAECRNASIAPQKLGNGTFTISNLGVEGILAFTPVINPPQTAILGVGAVEYRAKMTNEGLTHYPSITLSLTIDHRAVDGAPSARFMQALCKMLEQFTVLLDK